MARSSPAGVGRSLPLKPFRSPDGATLVVVENPLRTSKAPPQEENQQKVQLKSGVRLGSVGRSQG